MVQISIAFALLIGSGLLIGKILSMANTELPFPPAAILQGGVTLVDYQDRFERQRFIQRVRNEFLRQPEVKSAAAIRGGGYGGWSRQKIDFLVEGEDYPDIEAYPKAFVDFVSPGFFETLGHSLIMGRDFHGWDTREKTPVAIVNASFARRYFPSESPIGRRMRRAGNDFSRELEVQPYRMIVGVTPNLQMEGLEERGEDGAGVYLPLYQYAPALSNSFMLRGYGNQGRSLEPVLRQTLRRLDSRLILRDVSTPEENFRNFLAPRRMTSTIFLVFGALAVVLAAIGVYGVVSFSVSQRTREFGIRTALGSTPRGIGALILRHGSRLAFAGITGGVLLSVLLGHYLRSVARGLDLYDPRAYLAAAVILSCVILIACLAPASRAVRVQPAEALREE